MIAGILFLILFASLVGAIIYGRRLLKTEKSDAVFGNPARALGGWHWVVAGVSSILLVWLWFSWDAARSFFPKAGNELCQVAKVERALTPIKATFPFGDNRLLRGTELLLRDGEQIRQLQARLENSPFSSEEKIHLAVSLDDMESVFRQYADPAAVSDATRESLDSVAAGLVTLTSTFAQKDYPGEPDPAALEKAAAQPGWGRTSTELPPLPMTERGRKFDAISVELEQLAKTYSGIKNISPALEERLASIKTSLESIPANNGTDDAAAREDFIKDSIKILRRVDDGKIFPTESTHGIHQALENLDQEIRKQKGSLNLIDSLAMPGGTIMAGNNSCSEQGSGRWLPKPTDTMRTFARLANPNEGYKGFPLLWYKMKPLSEMVAFLVPDWIADLVPGDYPEHDANGQITENFKSKVYNIATGNFASASVPVPDGHVWDSIVRVLMGLFFGIVLGVPLGLFMGLSRFAKGFFDPLIELYRPIPPLAWAPLILTIFGIQDDGKIFLLFMVAFAIMVISARTGATGTQLSKIHAAHSLGASKWQIVRQVILPNSLPEILTGIRIAIGVCWGTLVAAEMLAGTTGIGFLENVARKQSDYEIIWMTIIILGVLGLIFDMIMRWIIHKSIPWRGKG